MDTPHVRRQDLPAKTTRLGDAPLPGTVFHYTSTAGLTGIVSTKKLWATDLRYLNDSSELHFGLTEILVALEKFAQVGHNSTSFLDRLAPFYGIDFWTSVGSLSAAHAAGLKRDGADVAARAIVDSLGHAATIGVACLCAKGDLLSQWRGYGAGGYAIGFDADQLHQRVRHLFLPLNRVEYGQPPSQKLLRQTFSRSLDALLAADLESQNPISHDELSLRLLGLACQIKDKAFESEEEYRIAEVGVADDGHLLFREGALGLTPYLALELCAEDELLPITSIRVAPGPEAPLREAAVRALLANAGYRVSGRGSVEVTRSSIPFRG